MAKDYTTMNKDALAIERAKVNARIDALKAELAAIDCELLATIAAGETELLANGKYKVAHVYTADGLTLDTEKAKALLKNWEERCAKVRKGSEYIRVTVKK